MLKGASCQPTWGEDGRVCAALGSLGLLRDRARMGVHDFGLQTGCRKATAGCIHHSEQAFRDVSRSDYHGLSTQHHPASAPSLPT